MSLEEKTVLMPQPERVAIGTQLSGTYQLDERIASGGMGEVFRGHNIHNGDPVAIKIVLPEFARDPTILALFRKEGLVLKRLAHDAIVRYEIFTVDPGIGRPYIAMEFVDGVSLAELIEKGPMPVATARTLLMRLASGLAAAHDLGVIHRDLSPDNVILPGADVARAKIIDFGIARAAEIGGATVVGSTFAGKYAFAAPEQLGMAGGEVTPRSDIYSLALVIAATLLGKPLDLGGSQFEVIEKRSSVPDLAGVDAGIRPLLEEMLRPDPADRPASMMVIVRRLGTAIEEAPKAVAEPIEAVPAPSPPEATVAPAEPAPGPFPTEATVIIKRPPPAPAPPPDPEPTQITTPRVEPLPPMPPPSEPTWISATRSAHTPSPSQTLSWDAPQSSAPPVPHWATSGAAASLPPVAHSAIPPPPVSDEEDMPWRVAGLGPRPAPAPPPSLPGEPPVLAGSPPPSPGSSRVAPLAIAACALALTMAGGGVYWSGILGGAGTPVPSPQGDLAPQGAPTTVKPQATAPAKPAQETSVQPSADKAVQAVFSAGERIAWLEAYRGDPCFYVAASSVSGAEMSMQGLGQSEAPFHKMIADYAARFGSEGDMTVQLIRPSQCAVTDFLSALHGSTARAPSLSLGSFKLANQQPLTGEVELGEGAFTYLLLVDDDGIVHDATRFIEPQSARSSFTIPMALKPGTEASGGGVPALLIAVSVPSRVKAIDAGTGKAASELLPAILGELGTAKAKASASARYFVISL
jgi:serine/threonine protein kinase